MGEADTGVEFIIYSNQKFHGFFQEGEEFIQANSDKTGTFMTQNRIQSGLNYRVTQSGHAGFDQRVTSRSGNKNRSRMDESLIGKS